MTKDNQSLIDSLFSEGSKLILAIPLIMMIFVLMNVFSASDKVEKTVQKQAKPLPSIVITQSESTAPARFDLNGPYECSSIMKDSSMSALILNKKISARIQSAIDVDMIIVSGDCAYSWKEKAKVGTRICGLSLYLGLIDLLPQDEIIKLVQSKGSNKLNESSASASLVNIKNFSCVKKEVDSSVFTPPKNVIFQESTGETLK
ncbi:MAG: hypothetical protein WCO06_05195 [Candidatus Roizmanbacteria bacterium]